MRGLLQWPRQFPHLCPWKRREEGQGELAVGWICRTPHQLEMWGKEAARTRPGSCLGWEHWALSRMFEISRGTSQAIASRLLELRSSGSASAWVCPGARLLQEEGGCGEGSWGHRGFLITPLLALGC